MFTEEDLLILRYLVERRKELIKQLVLKQYVYSCPLEWGLHRIIDEIRIGHSDVYVNEFYEHLDYKEIAEKMEETKQYLEEELANARI